GSGKSSLTLAGLVPALRAGKIEGSSHWPVIICRPGPDPLESLAVELLNIEGGNPDPARVGKMTRDLLSDQRWLHLSTRLSLPDADPSRRLVLVVDQFEELFTLCRDESLRSTLIDNLLYAANVVGGQTIVILTMRADFYGQCARYPTLAAALSDQQ